MNSLFTRRQALQNARFLEILGQTGNVRLAAREAGVKYGTIQHRRSVNAAFAQRWEAAVAAAHARFHLAGGKRGPEGEAHAEARRRGGAAEAATSSLPDGGRGTQRRAKLARQAPPSAESACTSNAPDASASPRLRANQALRTEGGEPVVVRTKNGTLQLRPAVRGRLTKAAEQAFLAALSATANIRLSAAAAGASAAAFYRRRRQSPAFAREMRLALEMGYQRLEAAALCSALADSHEDDGWRKNELPPIPPMTANQALQLLFLHEKSVRQGWEQAHRRRRRGESDEAYVERLRAMWSAEKRREAEDEAVRRALRFEQSGGWRYEHEAPPPELPPLELVTGWSKADPKKKPHKPGLALFGGWRIGEMRRKLREKG